MTRVLRGMVVALTAAAVGGLLDWGSVGGFTSVASAKPGKGKDDKGPKKGKDNLEKAYNALTDVGVWTEGRGARLPRDLAPLIEQAKDLYRDAAKAARDDSSGRADELAAAAHDAARGLVHALRAEAPVAKGLPAPPTRDNYELSDLLRRTRDRLEDFADVAPRGPGRAFFEAARRLYDQASRAGRDDARAIQLARAAEAWTHVGEHLDNADQRVGDRREPERRERERPRRLEDRPRRGPPPPPRD
jgi:hypothetical protein